MPSFELTLEKPLGIVFEESDGGGLFVAELQRRDGSGGAGSGDLWAAVWERLSAAASNSSSRVKWIALAGRSDLLADGGASLKHIVNTVEKLTDSILDASVAPDK